MRRFGKFLLLSLLLSATALAQTVGPVITALSPTSIIAGSQSFTLSVTGANFVAASQVRLNGANRATQFVDSRHLNVTILASDITQPRTLSFTVINPGTAASAAVTFEVVSNVPAITSIQPSIVAVGSDSFRLTVTGTGFAANVSTVRLDNKDLATTFVSENQLTVTIPASELNIPRKLLISVFNAPPINTTSNVVELTVSNTIAPQITLIDPTTVVAGSAGFTLNIIGSNFTANTVIRMNGAIVKTTFVDSTHLTTPIADFQILTARTYTFTVTNQTNNLTSNAVTLTVTQGNVPTIDSITPNAVQIGSGAQTIAITGMNFTPTSIVRFNGDNRPTTFIDSRHLNATLSSTDVMVEGNYLINVFNPPPNGGTSDPVTLTVFSQFAPIITFLDPPNFATASPTLKLTVTGSRFALNDNDVVLIDGTPRVTEFVGTTTLVATLLASDVARPGSHTVTVTNRFGFTSAPLTFTVSDQAGPVITSLSPPSAAAGAAPFVLTVNGMNFNDQSIVTIDTLPRTTTFVSPTQLTVQITAADLASAREMAIAVINPDGITSRAVRFLITVIGPTITSLTPTQAIAGDTGLSLLLKGTGFDANSVVKLNGIARTAVFDAAAGTLTVELSANDLSSPGGIDITVTSSTGTSAVVTLPVIRPQITAITPASIIAGNGNVTLTVEGSGFLPTSRILFLGTPLETTFDPTTGTLSATLKASDLNISGAVGILVQNSPNAISAPFIINVTSPGAPRIDALNPTSITAGSSSTQLTVNGVNFLPGAVVRINGVAKSTQFVSSNQLIATLSAADVATIGTFVVTVSNPDGTTTLGVNLTIAQAPQTGGRRRGVRR